MNQPSSPNQPAPDGPEADQLRARIASFLAGEWFPQDAAECSDLVSAWHALRDAGERDLPTLLDLTADLDALGLAEEQAGDMPAWVEAFDVDAALERARRDAEGEVDAKVVGPRGSFLHAWRPWAVAAAAIAVVFVGLRLRGGADGGTESGGSGVPVFGDEGLAGALVIAMDPDGGRRLVAQGLAEELDDVKRWLRIEVQEEGEGNLWSTVYAGELGSDGYSIDGADGPASAGRLRWRGAIDVPGELDSRWSVGWSYSD